MAKKFVHYFIPSFLVGYFILAFIPVLSKQKTEIFPFFSFKLYSKIPTDFTRYDLLINKDGDNEHYLLYQNDDLNKLERKNYSLRIGQMGDDIEESKNLNKDYFKDLLEFGTSVHLVKLTGDYIETAKTGNYDREIMKQLK